MTFPTTRGQKTGTSLPTVTGICLIFGGRTQRRTDSKTCTSVATDLKETQHKPLSSFVCSGAANQEPKMKNTHVLTKALDTRSEDVTLAQV